MSYVSKRGRRPNEYASKSSHAHVIRDDSVLDFLAKCSLPKSSDEIAITGHAMFSLPRVGQNPIRHIIAIDGGYSEVPVKRDFPSSTITFFQFGALIFSISDLDEISYKPFIDPKDIARLKSIQRFKLTLPTRNIVLSAETSLIDSVRRAIFDFFLEGADKFIDTLEWFIFQEYGADIPEWNLATCPVCERSNVKLHKDRMENDYSFECQYCNGKIYLTDVFRLHEAVDNELGAGGILGYLTTLLEQIVLIHLIKIILKTKTALLDQILFIKDGPLAFFGQTANMHRPMRDLVNYLFEKYNLYLAGLEKSGSFVEHADEIAGMLRPGEVLMLDNEYIYKYILPGKADPSKPYGRSTYYGSKLIFKTREEQIYVVTLPTRDVLLSPKKRDFKNIDVVLTNLEKLKCDMYDSSLIPIALVNKLVSLSDHPSSVILERFAKERLSV